jgi:hypothetical protein
LEEPLLHLDGQEDMEKTEGLKREGVDKNLQARGATGLTIYNTRTKA